jgi:peptidoglycan/LPS O-acetylase OafA/YrhL
MLRLIPLALWVNSFSCAVVRLSAKTQMTVTRKPAFLAGVRLSEALDPGRNNFDLLRLCAALAVMFGHSFWVQPAHHRTEPILKYTGLEYSGSLAVFTFFLISGMLVSASYDRQKSIARFVVLRLVRIFPALIACVFVTAFLLYPLFSSRGFDASEAVHYFMRNTTLFVGLQWSLPGLFEGLPLKVVNASLWTLPIELECYLLVMAAGLLGCFRSQWASAAFWAAAGGGFFWIAAHGYDARFFRDLTAKPTGYSFYAPPFFMLGGFLYNLREKVSVNFLVGVLLLFLYIFSRPSMFGTVLFYLFFTYWILLFATTPLLHRFRLRNDYSYGVYLWAFPIQQIVASFNPVADNLLGLGVAMPVTLAVAAISWHWVERPCIAFLRNRKSHSTTQQPIVGSVVPKA